MSTPFYNDFVDILDTMVSRFKIASADITNIPLLEKIASTKKPLIMSTGASYIEEIINAKSENFKLVKTVEFLKNENQSLNSELEKDDKRFFILHSVAASNIKLQFFEG